MNVNVALALIGVVGLSLGLLGGGGSILAVPVLVYVAHLAPAQAITLAAAFTSLSTAGALVGARLGRRISTDRLRASFATLVVIVGIVMAVRSV